MRMRATMAILAILSSATAACIGPQPARVVREHSAPRLVQLGPAPDLTLRGFDADGDIISAALRLASRNGGPDGTRIDPAFVPLLVASPAGQRFSALPGPRALVQGEPALSCPALAVAAGPDLPAALRQGLAECRAELAASRSAPACGCRVIALGDLLLAPPERFAYATGLGTRVLAAGRLDPLRYVAEERPGPGGAPETLIRAGARPVWLVTGTAADRAEVTALGPDGRPAGPALPARRQRIGMDRGRFLERITAERPGEGRMDLLIGF